MKRIKYMKHIKSILLFIGAATLLTTSGCLLPGPGPRGGGEFHGPGPGPGEFHEHGEFRGPAGPPAPGVDVRIHAD